MLSPPPCGCEDRLVTQVRAGGQWLFPEVPGFAYFGGFFEGGHKESGTMAAEWAAWLVMNSNLPSLAFAWSREFKSCL